MSLQDIAQEDDQDIMTLDLGEIIDVRQPVVLSLHRSSHDDVTDLLKFPYITDPMQLYRFFNLNGLSVITTFITKFREIHGTLPIDSFGYIITMPQLEENGNDIQPSQSSTIFSILLNLEKYDVFDYIFDEIHRFYHDTESYTHLNLISVLYDCIECEEYDLYQTFLHHQDKKHYFADYFSQNTENIISLIYNNPDIPINIISERLLKFYKLPSNSRTNRNVFHVLYTQLSNRLPNNLGIYNNTDITNILNGVDYQSQYNISTVLEIIDFWVDMCARVESSIENLPIHILLPRNDHTIQEAKKHISLPAMLLAPFVNDNSLHYLMNNHMHTGGRGDPTKLFSGAQFRKKNVLYRLFSSTLTAFPYDAETLALPEIVLTLRQTVSRITRYQWASSVLSFGLNIALFVFYYILYEKRTGVSLNIYENEKFHANITISALFPALFVNDVKLLPFSVPIIMRFCSEELHATSVEYIAYIESLQLSPQDYTIPLDQSQMDQMEEFYHKRSLHEQTHDIAASLINPRTTCRILDVYNMLLVVFANALHFITNDIILTAPENRLYVKAPHASNQSTTTIVTNKTPTVVPNYTHRVELISIFSESLYHRHTNEMTTIYANTTVFGYVMSAFLSVFQVLPHHFSHALVTLITRSFPSQSSATTLRGGIVNMLMRARRTQILPTASPTVHQNNIIELVVFDMIYHTPLYISNPRSVVVFMVWLLKHQFTLRYVTYINEALMLLHHEKKSFLFEAKDIAQVVQKIYEFDAKATLPPEIEELFLIDVPNDEQQYCSTLLLNEIASEICEMAIAALKNKFSSLFLSSELIDLTQSAEKVKKHVEAEFELMYNFLLQSTTVGRQPPRLISREPRLTHAEMFPILYYDNDKIIFKDMHAFLLTVEDVVNFERKTIPKSTRTIKSITEWSGSLQFYHQDDYLNKTGRTINTQVVRGYLGDDDSMRGIMAVSECAESSTEIMENPFSSSTRTILMPFLRETLQFSPTSIDSLTLTVISQFYTKLIGPGTWNVKERFSDIIRKNLRTEEDPNDIGCQMIPPRRVIFYIFKHFLFVLPMILLDMLQLTPKYAKFDPISQRYYILPQMILLHRRFPQDRTTLPNYTQYQSIHPNLLQNFCYTSEQYKQFQELRQNRFKLYYPSIAYLIQSSLSNNIDSNLNFNEHLHFQHVSSLFFSPTRAEFLFKAAFQFNADRNKNGPFTQTSNFQQTNNFTKEEQQAYLHRQSIKKLYYGLESLLVFCFLDIHPLLLIRLLMSVDLEDRMIIRQCRQLRVMKRAPPQSHIYRHFPLIKLILRQLGIDGILPGGDAPILEKLATLKQPKLHELFTDCESISYITNVHVIDYSAFFPHCNDFEDHSGLVQKQNTLQNEPKYHCVEYLADIIADQDSPVWTGPDIIKISKEGSEDNNENSVTPTSNYDVDQNLIHHNANSIRSYTTVIHTTTANHPSNIDPLSETLAYQYYTIDELLCLLYIMQIPVEFFVKKISILKSFKKDLTNPIRINGILNDSGIVDKYIIAPHKILTWSILLALLIAKITKLLESDPISTMHKDILQHSLKIVNQTFHDLEIPIEYIEIDTNGKTQIVKMWTTLDISSLGDTESLFIAQNDVKTTTLCSKLNISQFIAIFVPNIIPFFQNVDNLFS